MLMASYNIGISHQGRKSTCNDKTPYKVLFLIVVFTLYLHYPYMHKTMMAFPDNCEYTDGEFYQENVFVRNDRNNGVLELVDWTTGEELRVIAENVGEARIINWSPNCRYVAVVAGVSRWADEPNIDGSIASVCWTRYADIELHIVDTLNGGIVANISYLS